MRTLNLAVVLGIRSQLIKLAGLKLACEKWNRSNPLRPVNLVAIYSGQHYDQHLSAQYRNEYELEIDIDLTERLSSRDPDVMIGEMITALTKALRQSSYCDYAVVVGDANTTMAGAIAAKQIGMPLVHVESGLRSYDSSQPEERNRVVADHLSDVHFVSSRFDEANLVKEGILDFVFSGDVVRDLVSEVSRELEREIVPGEALLTIHRSEHLATPDLIENCCSVLFDNGFNITFVVHPRVVKFLKSTEIYHRLPDQRVKLVASMSHKRLLQTLVRSQAILTDSGALQREAYYLGRQILVLQDRPFWMSLIQCGFHHKVGPSCASIDTGIRWLERMSKLPPPTLDDFGQGNAGQIMLEHLWKLKNNE